MTGLSTKLTTSHARLAADVNQIRDIIACLPQITQLFLLGRALDLQISSATMQTTTKGKKTIKKKCTISEIKITRVLKMSLEIWLSILLFLGTNGKMQLEAFMDWLVSVECIWARTYYK